MLVPSETVAVPSTPKHTRPKHPLKHPKPDVPHLEIDPKCMSLCMSSIWTDIARIRTDTDSHPHFGCKNRPRDLGNEDSNLD